MRSSSLLISLALLGALGLSACLKLSFRKPMTLEESLKEHEIHAYYLDVKRAFAAGNADALADLFDADIRQPMTRPQILDWGRKFFAEHGSAAFKIDEFELRELGYQHAVVRLTYHVETRDGKGGFSGAELDTLKKRGKRWAVSAWEKIP